MLATVSCSACRGDIEALLNWHDATLLLVRHGETEWNRSGRYQGRTDTHLSALGIAQAHALAERLAQSNRDITIVCSPLARARETADIIARTIGIPLSFDARLRELAYGNWEGLRQDEIKQRWPEQLRRWKSNPDEVEFSGGETLAAVQNRVRSFLHDMQSRSEQLPVLAITHKAVIRVALLESRDEPLSRYRSLHIANTSITPIYLSGGRLRANRPSRVSRDRY